MKNLRTIKDIEKEFDDECCEFLDSGVHIHYDKAIDFISQSLRELLEQVVPEEKTQTFVNCSKHNLADDFKDCKDCRWEITPMEAILHNRCRQEVLNRIKHILNN